MISRGNMKVSNMDSSDAESFNNQRNGKINSLTSGLNMDILNAEKGNKNGGGFNGTSNQTLDQYGSTQAVVPAEERKYPLSVFFIICNEFCERFSYYGLRAVLILFFTQKLLWTEDNATTAVHLFTSINYFTPLLGAIIADSYLGKFRTIFYISIIYAIGNVVLSVSAVPKIPELTILGLCLIALGTGGIKPCVSAFGGDQFVAGQEEQQKRFFSFFYFSINAGSVISMFLTPIFRSEVHCLGEQDCFPLAFGVPAVLMITSLVVFVCGKPFYKIIPASGNVFYDTMRTIFTALRRKFSRGVSTSGRPSHWLDYAKNENNAQLVEDIKVLLRVLVLFTPLPVFWALFDQQSSRWTLQANKMDGYILGWSLKPDQMQVLNALLILIFVPIFEYAIYPMFAKCGLLKNSLQRIVIGGLLAGASFVVAALIQVRMDASETPISMFWQVPQYVLITFGEILFSITGLEFSYSQAPVSMRSLLQAVWLLTVSFGNILDVIIVKLHIFDKQWAEFLFFGALMAVDIGIFSILAIRYTRASAAAARQKANN